MAEELKDFKVLIIEDSYIVRLEVRQALEEYGIQVVELNNAEDFFNFSYRYHDLNLLLLDISLPGMDGLSALERIRACDEWLRLPVIMLTGRADKKTVEKAIIAGALDYIRKPFTSEILLEKVAQVLNLGS